MRPMIGDSIRLIAHLLFIQTITLNNRLLVEAQSLAVPVELPGGSVASGGDSARASQQFAPPQPLPAASYLSLDGLTLVVVFDKPVNLSASIETAERRRAAIEWVSEPIDRAQHSLTETDATTTNLNELQASIGQNESQTQNLRKQNKLIQPDDDQQQQCQPEDASENIVQHSIQGVQLCAKLLSRKSLKSLHKYKLYNCLWASRVQFLVHLARPIPNNQLPIKITFQRFSIGADTGSDQVIALANEREISLELNKLPLEALGLPLAPRLALTGPNQVPPCGQFSLSAHLSSPYGTRPGEQVQLSWSVERVGFSAGQTSSPSNDSSVAAQLFNPGNPGLISSAGTTVSSASAELRWRALQQLVASYKGNNLLLDSQLLNLVPQLYQFQVTATFTTSLNNAVSLNATHQVGRIDYETPIGTVYGTHLLPQHEKLNANQELLLLADVSIPDCASNVKQVGLYWQVSDPRVRFEQTYAPYYLARPNTLPEQTTIEFRLNVFYGIRVKKYSSAGAFVPMGDSLLDAHISDGVLVVTVGQDFGLSRSLELFASAEPESSDKFTYQWSCFDGKTAQACLKSSRAPIPSTTLASSTNNNNSIATRYELGGPGPQTPGQLFGQPAGVGGPAQPLVDRARQRQSTLRIPLSWFDVDAQLWFGLQRFDKQNPSQQSQTEYALVGVQPNQSSIVSIGPILIGRSRRRATIRNPLTGAIVLVAGAETIIVGRLRPGSLSANSFTWSSANHLHPLHWTVQNSTNPFNGERELLTELHLNKEHQLAYGLHRFSLSVCSQTGTTTASVQVDIVPSVNQCRVGVQLAAFSSGSGGLVVSVNYCNIPLGLSPITYQLYLANSSASDKLLSDEGAPQNGNSAASKQQQQQPMEDDYINETEEAFLDLSAEPLTMPQLSPVFSLNGLNGAALRTLLKLSGTQPPPANNTAASQPNETDTSQARIRFGARVCDRLQACRMFYSAPVVQAHLLSAASNLSAGFQLQSQLAGLNGSLPSATGGAVGGSSSTAQSIQAMIDSSRRASLAGNSIAAMALLNAAIKLGQGALSSVESTIQEQKSAKLIGNAQEATLVERSRLRDLVQTAMRDCLHYGAQSMQRQFHYSDSGQTSLVSHIISRILSAPQSGVEFKFKAMRLLVQLTRKSIGEQLNLKLNCLADMRALQAAYGALFGTFSHYSIDSQDKQEQLLELVNNVNNNNNNGQLQRHRNNHQHQLQSNASTLMSFSTLANGVISSFVSNSSTSDRLSPKQAALMQQTSLNAPATRKKREEAILAYLRSLRQAYRHLLASAAIQLPLGAVQQLYYASQDYHNGDTSAGGAPDLPASGAPSSIKPQSGPPLQSAGAAAAAATTTTTTPISSDIVSTLSHLTDLIAPPKSSATSSATIHVDLHEFGSILLQMDPRFVAQLSVKLASGQLRCRNDTSSASCSSFVLAISSFAGKAPFRALDLGDRLRVPMLEVQILSPLDGGNLLDYNQLRPDQQADHDYQTTVTFVVPLRAQEQQEAALVNGTANSTTSIESSATKNPRRRHKCYQFNEDLNEWIKSNEPPNEEIVQDLELAELSRVIRCKFSGKQALGVFAAFQGKPPQAETAVRSPVVLGLIALMGLVFLFSFVGCFASASQSNQKQNSHHHDDEDDVDDCGDKSGDEHGDLATKQQQQQRTSSRHPEQTFRNNERYSFPPL